MQDLPEASAFPSNSLIAPERVESLNLQQKLGHLYEDALAELLAATPRYNLLARSLQICRDSGETLGELDFLVRDLGSGQLIHLEQAVKFYLAVETTTGILLPGPDSRDNYFRKLKRMRSHQLRLTGNFAESLPAAFQKETIAVRHLVQGCVFDHVKASRPVAAESLNPLGRRGKWLHAKDCPEYFGQGTRLEIIPKPLWPVPLEILEGVALDQWEPNSNPDRCVMVRVSTGTLPYFIAPNGYPFG